MTRRAPIARAGLASRAPTFAAVDFETANRERHGGCDLRRGLDLGAADREHEREALGGSCAPTGRVETAARAAARGAGAAANARPE